MPEPSSIPSWSRCSWTWSRPRLRRQAAERREVELRAAHDERDRVMAPVPGGGAGELRERAPRRLELDAHGSTLSGDEHALLAQVRRRRARELERVDLGEGRLVASRLDACHQRELVEELAELVGGGVDHLDVA